MRSSTLICALASLAAHSVLAVPFSNSSGIPKPADFSKLEGKYRANIRAALGTEGCTAETVRVRKSWDNLNNAERTAYISAVKCLAAKPTTVDKSLAPGAVNRLDDFTYIHINQTNLIHLSGSFLSWHRIFIYRMEEALRDCGYNGALPYWDQARFSSTPLKSTVFSPAWFGGDGVYDPSTEGHGPYNIQIPGLVANITIPRPAGHGGGCIADGQFANFSVSLGPTEQLPSAEVASGDKYGYHANPRCLKRNIDLPSSVGKLTWANATLIISSPDIATFRNRMDNLWHQNAHGFLGKDGMDLFTSPNDPVFYLLHAQIDRLWALWQGQDLAARTFATDGYRTFEGIPLDTAPGVPPANATLEDVMDLGGGYRPTIRDGMAMTADGRCYVYE
ncbi:Uu.00g081120.m01.CDS01 [Anthostomella pinea]|uniref:Uu.00g081120.m01.CDS01 n=1 Tax=Anthostomella pinea TaxID=933095 RepID=A0AAI8VM28_9PEZI|nr:Uu.00g081120.m01.CDS01 [Anthostomella pinea]